MFDYWRVWEQIGVQTWSRPKDEKNDRLTDSHLSWVSSWTWLISIGSDVYILKKNGELKSCKKNGIETCKSERFNSNVFMEKIKDMLEIFMFFFVQSTYFVVNNSKCGSQPLSRMDLEQWLGFIKGKKKAWELRAEKSRKELNGLKGLKQKFVTFVDVFFFHIWLVVNSG